MFNIPNKYLFHTKIGHKTFVILPYPGEQQQIILNAAAAAGLNWGGNFQRKDPPHFYRDPGGDRNVIIQNATQDYLHLTNQVNN